MPCFFQVGSEGVKVISSDCRTPTLREQVRFIVAEMDMTNLRECADGVVGRDATSILIVNCNSGVTIRDV